MRQVPRYLVIGNGRVARHFKHYFALLGLFCVSWCRADPIDKLYQYLAQSTHILLLISDQSIEVFFSQYLKNANQTVIHFSGSLVTREIYGAHPLMTFSADQLYTLQEYQSIPFVLDHDAPEFTILFPNLPNQAVRLHTSMKAKYHALCVLSGNFSCLLWQKLINSMEQFGFPKDIVHRYLMQQTNNLIHDSDNALSGPLVRNDYMTINKNINALQDDPFQKIYTSFIECYNTIKSEELV